MKKNLTSLLFLLSFVISLNAQNKAQNKAPNTETPQSEHRAAKITREIQLSQGNTTGTATGTANVTARLLSPLAAGQDCATAIPVCQNSYTQNISFTGSGTSNEVSGTCLAGGETNSVWYQFTVQTSGTFSFNIATANDYDWALYNVTNISCSQLSTATPVSCNYSATYGNTGMSTAAGTTSGNSSIGASGSPSSPAYTVTAGQTFVLIIDNYSANTNGYTLTFNAATNGGGGTSTIFDNVNPTLVSVINNCNNTFTATLSEPVRCSTVSASSFSVSGGLSISSAVGVGCSGGASFTRQVLLTVSAPAACGVYNFNATNALQDACGNSLTPGTAISKTLLANTITATSSAAFVCAGAGTAVTLNTACAATGVTYKWSSGATTQSASVSPIATTTYTVTATGSDGCTKTATVSVTVNPLPVVTLNKLRGVLTAACNPFNVTASGPGGTTFVWSPGGATTATLGITAVGTYTVIGTLAGCASAPVSVTVSAAPSGCNVIFASNTGGGTGLTPTSPETIANAISLAECLGATVRMQVGVYNIDAPLTLPSNVTLDGGWSAGYGNKTSSTGTALTTTTINRTTVGAYPYDGIAAAPALIAIKATNATGFRLQDIAITTANAPATSAGNKGVSTYTLLLNGCSSYNIVRTQLLPGTAGAGVSGANGGNGGNGTNGSVGGQGDDSCNFSDDIGGGGGGGGGGGTAGTSPIGAPGTSGTSGGSGGAGRDDSNSAQAASGSAACGAGGAGGTSASTSGCGGGNAANGSACATAGVAGTAGTSGSATFSSGLFQPANGTNGTAGTAGAGGGGGGGGARNTSGICNGSGNGGSGGGGGGGGGGGAQLGTGAGGSFGVFIWAGGTSGVFTDCAFNTPTAGTTGAGGAGGAGGAVGAGGAALTSCGPSGGQVHKGGAGGAGSAGGNGGSGGSGSAGQAFRAYVNGTAPSINGTTAAVGGSTPTAFALTAQSQINWDGKSCTNTLTSLTAISGPTTFTSTGGVYAAPNMSWTTTGRKDVTQAGSTYAGFVDMVTAAPAVDYTASVPFNIPDNVFHVCEGSTLTFTSNIPLDNSITNYKWDFDAASGVTDVNSATANTTTATFNTAGPSYNLIHNVTTACCGPVSDKVYIIKVDPRPSPVISTATTICNGDAAALSVSPITAGSIYAWSTAQTPSSISVSPTTTTSYTVMETTVFGCTRTAVAVAVTVLNKPTAATATGLKLLCEGDATTLALAATNSTDFDWTRTGPAGPATSGSGTSIATGVILLEGDYDYTITPKNVSGGTTCFGTPIAVKVIVQKIPTVTAVGDMCVGTSVLTSGGARDYSLFNSTGLTQLSPATGFAPTVSGTIVAGANNFQLQGKSAAGCLSLKTPIVITGRAIPAVSTTATVNCPTASVAVTNTASGTGTNTFVVTSLTPAGTIPASNATGSFTLPVGSTAATFQITSQYGCVSTAQAIGFGCALPIELLFFTGKIEGVANHLYWQTANEDNSAWHVVERSADGSNDWSEVGRRRGAGTSSIAHDYDLLDEKPLIKSYYRLRNIDYDGLSQLSNVIVLERKRGGFGFNSVYPIPTNDGVTVNYETENEGKVTFRIVDVLGRVLQTQTENAIKGLNAATIDLSEYPSGNYLLLMDNGTTRQVTKLVKAK